MLCPTLRKRLSKWGTTPFHPQWYALRREARILSEIGARLHGTVLDIGCADQRPARFIPRGTRYIGLDYYQTATSWYGTRPHVYGDAQALPFPPRSVDSALLLNVLEHLPRPSASLSEIHRVLKPQGTLVLQVPFLYPIHDAPLDFTRWTLFGLRELARTHGFRIEQEMIFGHPLETAALLANVALTKSVLNWIQRRHPAAAVVVLLPFFVLVSNGLSWALSRISPVDAMMPSGYQLLCTKA